MGIFLKLFFRGSRPTFTKTYITCCMILVSGYILKVHTCSLKLTVLKFACKENWPGISILRFPNFKTAVWDISPKVQMFISSSAVKYLLHLKVSHQQNYCLEILLINKIINFNFGKNKYQGKEDPKPNRRLYFCLNTECTKAKMRHFLNICQHNNEFQKVSNDRVKTCTVMT